MGIAKKHQNPKTAAKRPDVDPVSSTVQSEARQLGRWLRLTFTGSDEPELYRIEFRCHTASASYYWQRGDLEHPMTAKKLPPALSYAFLGYLAASSRTPPEHFDFRGAQKRTPAASLGDAISQNTHRLHKLLAEQVGVDSRSRVGQIFGGNNVDGKDGADRVISIRRTFLPPDCIEIVWHLHGKAPLEKPQIEGLLRRIRRSLGIPDEPAASEPRGEGNLQPDLIPPPIEPAPTTLPVDPRNEVIPRKTAIPKTAAQLLAEPPSKPPPPQATEPEPSLQKQKGILASFLAGEIGDAIKTLRQQFTARPPVERQPRQLPTQKQVSSKTDIVTKQFAFEAKDAPKRQQSPTPDPPRIQIPPIAPHLFAIQNPAGLTWSDSKGLVNFGSVDSEHDIWRLRDACGGVLILGAPRSGKTSGSGFLLSATFLQNGFGGLVMTTKTEEAQRWQRLCARFGRAQDCIVISPGSPHRLNVLAYESQRPGIRIGLTDDLIAFFRVLITVVSKRPTSKKDEDFWFNSVNDLMRGLFDVYLLAGEPLTIDSLKHFVTQAANQPDNVPQAPFCGPILARAQASAKSPEDLNVFRQCLDYWEAGFPSIPDITRGGITTSFASMAAVLTGRGIRELVSSETTLTPECILSGKIVILDLSTKQHGQGALLVQAAWKYLFQRAIEWRADKGRASARPVFLWEDEGHTFFSQHDVDFQPTARDCRAIHVILSQTIHNFLHLGHSPHAVHAVFATTNTQIFHTNGDPDTNRWASEKMGTELTTQLKVSVSSEPKHPEQPKNTIWDSWTFWPAEEEQKVSTSFDESRDKAVQPERFFTLKMGGDGECEAFIIWVGHKFKATGRHYRLKSVFENPVN
jgi:hypothetical protein